jgi:DNA repair protein RadA/Sms
VDEIGVFRMTAAGLVPVTDVSEVFLAHRQGGRSGSAVAAVMEGSRPLLVEVQALCTRTSWGSPQRASQGVDRQRLALLLAVLEKWAGVSFGELDVFTNVVGGVRVVETASDLALAVALVSSVLDRELPPEALFVGELGLAGELRAVPLLERRLTEAARLGFRRVYLAQRTGTLQPPGGLELVPVSDIRQLMPVLFP